MMPEEWPIAASANERNGPARAAGRGRLATVRADFFLSPAERLTEQERALMSAMLDWLVGDVAAELRAILPTGSMQANDGNTPVVEALIRSGLLDRQEIMALLVRRADEERIGSAARARSGHREGRVLQSLVSHDDGPVSAAAMGLILARGRRRDRFGRSLLAFDDLSRDAADHLVNAVAAALRLQNGAHGSAEADAQLSDAADALLSRHEPQRSVEALTAKLVQTLAGADALSDELQLACAQEGEIAFLAQAAAQRGGIDGGLAFDELLSGDAARVMRLFGVCGFSRALSAGILAGIGDLLGLDDPGAAIACFDQLTSDEITAARSWLEASPRYRAALEALSDRG